MCFKQVLPTVCILLHKKCTHIIKILTFAKAYACTYNLSECLISLILLLCVVNPQGELTSDVCKAEYKISHGNIHTSTSCLTYSTHLQSTNFNEYFCFKLILKSWNIFLLKYVCPVPNEETHPECHEDEASKNE